jgi:hypothetical protein
MDKMRSKFRGWNANFRASIRNSKQILLHDLSSLESVMECRDLSDEEISTLFSIKNNLFSIYQVEEIYWQQRARMLWLREGDANTKFFHKIASSNRRCQQITSLDIDNVPCTDASLIKSHVFSYYKSMPGTKIFLSAFLDAALWSEHEKVSPEENAMLCIPFSSEEIHKALFQMNPNKAPDPDGFSVLFYQTYWDLIKEDVVSMFNDFHCNNFDISRLNHALICLIPKINDPTNIK